MSDEVRRVSRRSFLGRVAGGAAFGAAAIVVGTSATPAAAQTDRDPYDPVGRGRGGSGVTDSDTGRYADPIGRGRGRRGSGVTDRDPYDPVGNGRGRRRYRSGITDRDPSDPVGNGRGRRRRYSGCTDSDGGRYADPGGNGRCRG